MVAPEGAPNEGNLLVSDPSRARVQEFTETGVFVRTFGGGVVSGGATGTGNLTAGSASVTAVATASRSFSVGQAISGDGIPAGTTITAVGASTLTLSQPVEAGKTASGVALSVAAGTGNVATDEVQTITLNSAITTGFYKLRFTAPNPQNVTANQLSENIPFNASPAEVEEALEALTNIGAGNVTVTSSNPGGGTAPGGPYRIEFSGSRYADTDVSQLARANGVPNVDVLGNAGVAVSTLREGAGAFEVCAIAIECGEGVPFVHGTQEGEGKGQFAAEAARGVAEDGDGNLYVAEARRNQDVGASNLRVQRFKVNSAGAADVEAVDGSFACPVLCGTQSSNEQDNTRDIAVDDDGYVYVTKSFPVGTGEPPADLETAKYQMRILKVDPDTEAVAIDPNTGEATRALLVNPGRFNRPGQPVKLPAMNTFGFTGFAVSGSGLPAYVANAVDGLSRVIKVDRIDGLTASTAHSGVGGSAATLEATITPATTTPLDTFYRFEYTRAGRDEWAAFRIPPATSGDDIGRDIGNGDDGGESGACSAVVGSRAATCHVSERLDGLERDQLYEFRLVASTEAKGIVYTSDPEQFETAPSRPSVVTGTAVWSGPPASAPSLTFNGTVNPGGGQTSFSFEYGTAGPCSANPCETAPPYPRDIGHGSLALDVTATVASPSPNREYHYRIRATNSEGTSFGADSVVGPSRAGDGFVELVSEGESYGTGVYPVNRLQVSDDGLRATFGALAFGQPQSAPGFVNPVGAIRTGSGWETVPMTPSRADPPVTGLSNNVDIRFDSELTKSLWMEMTAPGSYRLMSRGFDGSYSPVGPLITPLRRSGSEQDLFDLQGTSLDQSTIVFANRGADGGKAYFPDEPFVEGAGNPRYSNLYEVAGAGSAEPVFRLVNRGVDDKPIGGACGARLGGMIDSTGSSEAESTRAVSADGSVIYFSVRPGSPSACDFLGKLLNPIRVFKRVDGTSTTEVSACAKTPPATCPTSGDDFFHGASADGSRVFFASPRQLTDTDTDTGASCSSNAGQSAGCDLYLYDQNVTQRLTEVSAGPSANVLGVLDVSMDGSRVYFVAEGALTGANAQGDTPSSGDRNLYVFQRKEDGSDRLGFVGKLSPRVSTDQSDRPDSFLWLRDGTGGTRGRPAYALPYYDGLGTGRTDGDGHLLVFASEEQLVDDDLDAAVDLYRYDDDDPGSDQLACLTCARNNDRPIRLYDRPGFLKSNGNVVQRQRIASEDGDSIVFMSEDQLLSEDTNLVNDVYLWQPDEGGSCAARGATYLAQNNGCLSVVSGVTGSVGVQNIAGLGGERSQGAVISPDGKAIFFLTRATILPQDVNNGAWDWYAVRVDGGFPQQPGSSDPCQAVGELCQGPDPDPAAVPPALPSAAVGGPGNVSGGPQPCAKGKVRRGKRCVAKRALARRACAKRKGKAKRRCVRKQMQRLNKGSAHGQQASKRHKRANTDRGGSR